jgi:phage tail-like protein
MQRKYSWNHLFICSAVLLALAAIGGVRLHGQESDGITTVGGDSTSYVFDLQLDGSMIATYTECSGLGSSNDILENETTTESGQTVIAKTPGAFRWNDVTLHRTGVIEETIWAWRKATQEGNAEQAFRDGAIIMRRADDGARVATWTFTRGWAASLNLNDSEEELTIVHGGLEYTTASGGTPRPTD